MRQEYYDAIANNGVGSSQAAAVRRKYIAHKQAELFGRYADTVDEMLTAMGLGEKVGVDDSSINLPKLPTAVGDPSPQPVGKAVDDDSSINHVKLTATDDDSSPRLAKI
jgi:hypothetical protein